MWRWSRLAGLDGLVSVTEFSEMWMKISSLLMNCSSSHPEGKAAERQDFRWLDVGREFGFTAKRDHRTVISIIFLHCGQCCVLRVGNVTGIVSGGGGWLPLLKEAMSVDSPGGKEDGSSEDALSAPCKESLGTWEANGFSQQHGAMKWTKQHASICSTCPFTIFRRKLSDGLNQKPSQ